MGFPQLGPGQQPAANAGGGGRLPAAGWPTKGSLDYTKVLIEVILLVIAIPWLLKQLLKHPGGLSEAAAKHHLKP